jgi:hypothetical protein
LGKYKRSTLLFDTILLLLVCKNVRMVGCMVEIDRAEFSPP